MKIKDLKKFFENLPDDTEVIIDGDENGHHKIARIETTTELELDKNNLVNLVTLWNDK